MIEAPKSGDRKGLRRAFGDHRRYAKRRREIGKLAPRPSPGRMLTVGRTAEQRRVLWRQLGANPGATLEQHRGFRGSKSGKVPIVTMSRGMRKKLECKGFAFYG